MRYIHREREIHKKYAAGVLFGTVLFASGTALKILKDASETWRLSSTVMIEATLPQR
jgi:hypothetical protein